MPVEPHVFQYADADSHAVFREVDGEITHFFTGTGAFIKLNWFESQPFHLAMIGVFLLTFLSAAAAVFFPGMAQMNVMGRAALGGIGLLNLDFWWVSD